MSDILSGLVRDLRNAANEFAADTDQDVKLLGEMILETEAANTIEKMVAVLERIANGETPAAQIASDGLALLRQTGMH